MITTTVTVDLTGFHELVGKTQAALIAASEDVADEGAKVAVESAKDQGRFKDRTGLLRRSIIVTDHAVSSGKVALATFAARTHYAAYVEWGTVQHWIRPRMARSFVGPTQEGQRREKSRPRGRGDKVPGMLKFYSAKLGRWVQTIEVRHPGTSARLYMHAGARAASDAMVRRLRGDVARRIGAIWR